MVVTAMDAVHIFVLCICGIHLTKAATIDNESTVLISEITTSTMKLTHVHYEDAYAVLREKQENLNQTRLVPPRNETEFTDLRSGTEYILELISQEDNLPLFKSLFTTATCPVGWIGYRNSCYMRIATNKGHYASAQYCKELSPTAQLANPRTEAEYRFITGPEILPEGSRNRVYWIGIEVDSNGTAFYSDGVPVSEELSQFRGSPVDDDYECVALHPTGGWQWTKTQCVVAAHFICEYPVPQPPRNIEMYTEESQVEVTWTRPQSYQGSQFTQYGIELQQENPETGPTPVHSLQPTINSHNFMELNSGFEYYVTLYTEEENAGISARYPAKLFITNPPSANIDLIVAGYSSITVDWNVEFEGENTSYHYFSVEYGEANGNSKNNLTVYNTNSTISHLDPYTEYAITVYSAVSYDTWYGMRTKRSIPSGNSSVNYTTMVSPAFNFRVEEATLSETGFAVTWESAIGEIDFYELRVILSATQEQLLSLEIDSRTTRTKIENLSPGTQYDVTMTSVKDLSRSYSSRIVQTTRPRPITPFQALMDKISSIDTVSFHMSRPWTDDDIFDNYKFIFQRAESEPIEKDFDRELDRISFDGLTPGGIYDAFLYTVKDGVLSSPRNLTNVMLPVAPPENVQLLIRDETVIKFGWDAGKGDVTNFLVRCDNCPGDTMSLLDAAENNTYMVLYLEPGKLYSFSIQGEIVMKDTQPPASQWVNFEIRTRPNKPTGVNINASDKTSVTLQWDPVDGQKDGYVVEYGLAHEPQMSTVPIISGTINVTSNATDKMTAVISDLVPGISYKAVVSAVSGSITSLPVEARFITDTSPLEGIGVVSIDETTTEIAWNIGIGGYNFFEVHVTEESTGWEVTYSVDTNTSYVIESLKPGTLYYMYVQKFSTGGKSAPLGLHVQTRPSPVSDVEIYDVTEDGFAMRWTPPKSPYSEFVVSLRDGNNRDLEFDSKTVSVSFTSFDGLMPGKRYLVEIRSSINSTIGYGVENVVTLYPLPPLAVISTGKTATSLSVSWTQPMGSVGSYFATWEPGNGIANITAQDGGIPSLSINELTPGVTYDITVYSRSEDNAKISKMGDSIAISTDEDYPGPPSRLEVKVIDAYSVQVSWEEPAEPNGVILAYHIEYTQIYPNPDNLGEYVVTTDEKFSVNSKMVPGTWYRVRVKSENGKGSNVASWTDELFVRTDESVPGAVDQIMAEAVEEKTLEVSWNAPRQPNGEMVMYRMTTFQNDDVISVIDFQRNWTVHPLACYDKTNAVVQELYSDYVAPFNNTSEGPYFAASCDVTTRIENLSPYTAYVVMVQAFTAVGGGPVASATQTTTEETPSGPPRTVTVTSNGPTFVNVSWEPPKFPNGDVKYHIVGFPEGNYETADTFYELSVLEPFSVYAIYLYSSTIAGVSSPTDWLLLNTTEDVPTSPVDLDGEVMNSESVYLKWRQPDDPKGIIESYNISIYDYKDSLIRVDIVEVDDTNVTYSIKPALHSDTARNRNIPRANESLLLDIVGSKIPDFAHDTLTHVVKDLTPYTRYRFDIEALTAAGAGPSESIMFLTHEDKPGSSPTNLTYANISSTAVSLSWLQPKYPNGEIISYSVMYISKHSEMRIHVTNKTEAVLDNLLKNSPYSVFVNSKTSAGEGPSSMRLQMYTDEDEPDSPPVKPTYFNVTPSVIRLEWTPPKIPNGIIRFYMVYFRNSTGEFSHRSTQPDTFLTDLKVYGEYWIQITASTRIGDGDQRSAPLYVRTGQAQPGTPPYNLTYDDVTATTVALNWRDPLEPNGVITHYEINVLTEEMEANVTTPDASTSYVLGGLLPDSEYTIAIRAHTKYGDGGQISESLDIVTMEAEPGSPPTNLTYRNISSTSVEISWEEPLVSNGVLTGYRFYDDANGISVEEKSIEISGLQPFSMYTYHVGAMTAAGAGPNATLIVYTEEDVPSSPPREVNYTQISSTEVLLSWQPPVIPNGHIILYDVEVTGNDYYNKLSLNTTHALLTDLETHSSYDVVIKSSTKAGFGDVDSGVITFKTLQDAPGDPPQNVDASPISSTSIEVSWDPPTKPNGDILYYKIYLQDSDGKVSTKKVTEGTSAVVGGLSKYSWYDITVTGSTILGDGNQTSAVARIQTLPGAPESGVSDFRVSEVTARSILFAWSEPEIKTGEFVYLLELSNLDVAQNWSAVVEGQSYTMQHGFRGLKPFTHYEATVTPSVKDVDQPGPETTLRFQTLEAIPGPVVDIEIVEVTHRDIAITWNPPLDPNGVITLYKIRAMSGLRGNTTVSADMPLVTLTDLYPNTEYAVIVTPVNSAGEGLDASIIVSTTAGVPEQPPQNLKIDSVQSREATISWETPSQANIDIVSHKVIHEKLDRDTETAVPDTMQSIETDGVEAKVTLRDLDPYSIYSVTVKSATDIGYGPSSDPLIIETSEAESSAPILSCVAMLDWTIQVSWDEPLKPNGAISRYMINYRQTSTEDKFEHFVSGSLKYVVEDVKPFAEYDVTIRAENGAGLGEAANCLVLTPEGKPSAPLDLSLVDATSSSVTFEWTEPDQLNGNLLHYEIRYTPGFSCWANGGDLVDPGNEMICILKTEDASKTLMALRSYSEYIVSVGAVTGGGLGNMTAEITLKTKTAAPDYPPRSVEANSVSSTAVNVTWDEPHFFAGPTWYKGVAYLGDAKVAESEVVNAAPFYALIEGLEESVTYSVAVSAITNVGELESKRTLVTTDDDAPSDGPAKVEVLTEAGNSSIVTVQFLPPNDSNGALYRYKLQYKMGKDGDVTTVDIYEEDLPYSQAEIMLQNLTLSGFLGGRGYYFRMNAATLVGTGPWTDWVGPVVLPALAPPLPASSPIVSQLDAEQSISTTTLGVELCLFSEVNGPLSNVTVIVAEEGGNLDASPLHWFEAYYETPSPPYSAIATYEYAETCDRGGMSKRSVDSQSDTFLVGEDGNCANTREPYCNGPLKSNTAYRLKLRGTTTSGEFTDTEFSEPVKTHPTFLQANFYLLVGLLAGLAVLILLVCILIRHCRKRTQTTSFNGSQRRHSSLDKRISSGGVKSPSPVDNLSFVMEPTKGKNALTRPVAKSSFVTHVAKMSEHNDKGFLSEFEDIASASPHEAKSVGSQSVNAAKNRFIDIVPYDSYRVKIEDIASVEGSGYINASYVPGSHSPEQYIATQSPLANTKNEFWRMVWETGCQTLIMLCDVEQDGNEEKISKYWPNLSQTLYYGNLGVQCSVEEKKPEWTVRTFIIVKREQRRQVTQYQFTQWPLLRGVPDDPRPFARFFQATRRSMKSSLGRPVVVMCSSGSGRSAVFIAYDMLVNALSKENRVDPCGVVSELRNYRPSMVQTVVEYSFLHRCLAYSLSKSSIRSPTGDGMEETTMF